MGRQVFVNFFRCFGKEEPRPRKPPALQAASAGEGVESALTRAR